MKKYWHSSHLRGWRSKTASFTWKTHKKSIILKEAFFLRPLIYFSNCSCSNAPQFFPFVASFSSIIIFCWLLPQLINLCMHKNHWLCKITPLLFLNTQCCGVVLVAGLKNLNFLTWQLGSSCQGKVKDRREHFTRRGCWMLQTCFNSPVMLLLTTGSFPTDIPTWLEGCLTAFLSFPLHFPSSHVSCFSLLTFLPLKISWAHLQQLSRAQAQRIIGSHSDLRVCV